MKANKPQQAARETHALSAAVRADTNLAASGLGKARVGVSLLPGCQYPQMYPQTLRVRMLAEADKEPRSEPDVLNVGEVYGRPRMAPRAGFEIDRKFLSAQGVQTSN